MADVYLTQRDIDYISRVVATEVPASIARTDPEEYSRMVGAVVDTITNRMASGEYPSTVTGVVNQYNQFSAINGPVPGAYGRVQNAPKASQALQSLVASHIADISQGVQESEIGGSVNYANPNFSDAKNLKDWVNPMIEAGALKLGIGDAVHYHGIIPGDVAVGPYNLTAEGIPSGGIPVPYGPNDDPFSLSAQAQAIDGFSGLANPVSSRETVAMTGLPEVAPFGSLFGTPKEEPASQPAEVAAQQESVPGEWGVINGVGPVYTPAVETWSDMAAAQPVQSPMSPAPMGLLAGLPSDGFSDMAAAGPFGGQFATPADRFAQVAPNTSQPFDRHVQTTSIPTSVDPNAYQPGSAPMIDVSAVPANRVQSVAMTPQPGLLAGLETDGFSQMASAGPFGGDYAAPADRFSPQIAAAPQISQADIARGFFNATAANQMDPSFTEGLMSAQNPVVPTAVETTSYTPSTETAVDIASSRFSTPAKTSRIGQEPTFDAARMPGLFDPTTNTAALTPQPSDIGGFLAAAEAQRGPPTGLLSAEAQAMQGHVYNESLKAEAARQAAMAASNPGLLAPNFDQALNPTVASMPTPSSLLASAQVPAVSQQPAAVDPMQTAAIAPNFAQAVNPSLPSLASTPVTPSQYQMQEINQAGQIPGVIAAGQIPAAVSAYVDQPVTPPAVAAIDAQTVPGVATPSVDPLASAEQQAAGYQQFAAAAPQITNLSGTTGIWDDGTAYSNAAPVAAQTPALQQDDQPDVADQAAVVEGPATTPADEQQAQITAPAKTIAARTTPAAAQTKGLLSGLLSKESAIGGVIGGAALGPIGGILGALMGQQVARNGGVSGLLSGGSFSPPTTQMAGGINNIASIYGGSQPPGTYATASNGAKITAQPGGYTTYENKYGVVEAIGPDGKISSYFGGGYDPNDPESSTSSGGFFGGLFD